MPTPEDVSRLAEVGVRIANQGGTKVVGVPGGADELPIESVEGIMPDKGGAEQLARMLPRMPDKQAATLIATGSTGREGSELMDQLATIGERDGGARVKKGICKSRLIQTVSVTSQVAISRRVHPYKLALRDRGGVRGKREEQRRLMQMAWGWQVDVEHQVGSYKSWRGEGQ